ESKPIDGNLKHRTPRAASQFKSPLATTFKATSDVRLTPTIQALERKVQQLKRASKVKNDDEENTLQGLLEKWTEAGREVAWELWQLIKDKGDVDSMCSSTGKRSFESNWGWDESDSKRVKLEGGTDFDTVATLEGRDQDLQVQSDNEVEEKRVMTLGIMLRQLGIDPQTLGWDEEEGLFCTD
ncbi:hypothetical protein K435DRAFT_647145, partial [Dendrothele bispora CBS 962.96]